MDLVRKTTKETKKETMIQNTTTNYFGPPTTLRLSIKRLFFCFYIYSTLLLVFATLAVPVRMQTLEDQPDRAPR